MRKAMLLAAAVLFAMPTGAQAQWGYGWAGVALSIPTGDAGDAMEAGWLGTVGIGINVKSMTGLSVQGEGVYGSHSAKVGTGSTKLTGALANLAYEWNAESKLHPYVYAGGGVLSSDPSGASSSSDGAYQVGGGFSYMARPKLSIWADIRYLSSGSGTTKMTLMPIAVGISCPFGTGM